MADNIKEILSEIPSDADRFWVGLAEEAKRNQIASYADAAKQLISINGVLQGLYLAAVSFSGLKQQIPYDCALQFRYVFS